MIPFLIHILRCLALLGALIFLPGHVHYCHIAGALSSCNPHVLFAQRTRLQGMDEVQQQGGAIEHFQVIEAVEIDAFDRQLRPHGIAPTVIAAEVGVHH